MTRDEIRHRLAIILEEVCGVSPSEVVDEATFRPDSLDVDSLTMVEVIVEAEQAFGVKIPDEEVHDIERGTVGELVDRVAEKMSANATGEAH